MPDPHRRRRPPPGQRPVTVAVVEHRTSGLADPQLHAHALIATKVRDAEGYWLSADPNEMYANVRTTGALYQSAPAGRAAERLGVTWGPSGISQETPPPRFRSGSEDRGLPRH